MVEMSYVGAMKRAVGFRLALALGLGFVRALAGVSTPPGTPGPGTVAPNEGAPAAPAGSELESDTNAAPVSPYQLIVIRNAFGLRTPPPAPSTNATAPVVASALKLTGVTTLLGGKRAMFLVQEPGKTNLTSGLVREGDWDGVITNLQVLSIDERGGVVQVRYGGTELALNFDDNGIKAPAGPVPGMPMPGLGRPGMPPVPGQPVPMVQPASGAPVAFNNADGYRRVPNRPNRITPAASEAGAPPSLTPEQQLMVIQAQEELGRQQGVPMPPSPPGASGGATPLPPTPGTVPYAVLPPTPGN